MMICPSSVPPQSSASSLTEQRLKAIHEFTALLGCSNVNSQVKLNSSPPYSAAATAPNGTAPSPRPENSNSPTAPPGSKTRPSSAASMILLQRANADHTNYLQGNTSAVEVFSSSTSASSSSANSILSPSPRQLSSAVNQYLYRDDDSPFGGAIVSIPDLDLRPPQQSNSNCVDGATGNNNNAIFGSNTANHYPNAPTNDDMCSTHSGETLSFTSSTLHSNSMSPPASRIPAMTASVLEQVTDIIDHGNNSKVSFSMFNMEESSAQQTAINNPLTSLKEEAAVSPLSSSKLNSSVISTKDSENKTKNDTDATTNTTTATKTETNSNSTPPIIYTRSSLPHAPGTMIHSLFDSFSSLVVSRIKAWTLLLLKQSLRTGDEDSRSKLLALLATKNKITSNAMITLVHVQSQEEIQAEEDYCDSDITSCSSTASNNSDTDVEDRNRHRLAHVNENQKSAKTTVNNATESQQSNEKRYDLTLPVVFEVYIDLKLHDQPINIYIKTSGTVSANFHTDSSLMTYFKCQIDTNKLMSEMATQTHRVVLNAVKRVTSSSSGPSPTIGLGIAGINPNIRPSNTNPSTTQSSSFFHSVSGANIGTNISMSDINGSSTTATSMLSMNRSNYQQQQPQHDYIQDRTNHDMSNNAVSSSSFLPRVSSSLLRRNRRSCDGALSSIESGSSGGGMNASKRQRSVTWDDSTNDLVRASTDRKRQKKMGASMSTLKRSIQSFGKPDSTQFKSAKNATFSEFGMLDINPKQASKYGGSSGRSEYSQPPATLNHILSMHSLRRKRHNPNNSSGGIELDGDGGKNMNASFHDMPPNPRSSNSQRNSTRDLCASLLSLSAPPQQHKQQQGGILSSGSNDLFRKPSFTEISRNAKYAQPSQRSQNSFMSLLSKSISK